MVTQQEMIAAGLNIESPKEHDIVTIATARANDKHWNDGVSVSDKINGTVMFMNKSPYYHPELYELDIKE